MLPKLLLAAFFGSQIAAGAIITNQGSQPVDALEIVQGDRWSYEDCGTPDDLIELKSISISPEPPKPGQDLQITATGTVKQRIEEGAYADVLVKIGLIKLLQKTFDICEEARNANATIQCPVEPGEYTIVQNVTLPKEIPPAKFLVALKAYSVDDDDAACVNIRVDFTPHRGKFSLW